MAELMLNVDEWQSADCHSFISMPFASDVTSKSLSSWELHGIKTALKESDGNISLAAKNLGITRSTLYKKLEHFRLDKTGEGLVA